MTWQELIKAFEKERLRNVELIRIAKRVEAGTLTFEQASLYARILGDVLGRLYGETDIFPDGVTEREALTVLKPSLTRAYSVASGPAMAAQEIQNKKFGVPLKAWRPAIKPGRIEGLAVELAMQGFKEEIFTPQVVNLTQSAVDDTMSVNSYNLAKEGYETTYIRKLNSEKSCAYCQGLAGKHTAKDAPEGFFGHHRNCVCTIEIVGMAKRGKGYAKEYGREKKRRERIETRKAVEGVKRTEPTPEKLAERVAVRGLVRGNAGARNAIASSIGKGDNGIQSVNNVISSMSSFEPVSEEKVVNILRKEYRKWVAMLSKEELHAIRKYTKNSLSEPKNDKFYQRLNAMLRGEIPEDANMRRYANIISSALKRQPIDHDVKCYRGSDIDPTNGSMIGDIISGKQFMSASVISSRAFRGAYHIVVYVPKGTPCAYVDMISRYPKQRELIIDKDVNYVVRLKKGNTIILEAVKDNES